MRIRKLIDELNNYTKLYDEGHPAISDKEWDNLYFELAELEKSTGLVYPDSPTQSISYQVVNALSKVEHNHAMLSLEKTKDVEEVKQFVHGRDFIGMAKMDGLTCSIRYVDGKLVSAETRGNGQIGEDILHNALVMPSIPTQISYTDELIIDGEIICTYEDFKEFSNDYKNPRNFASGSVRLLDAAECSKRKLTFVVWEVIDGLEEKTLHGKLLHLEALGFTIVPYMTSDYSEEEIIEGIQEKARLCSYPIDGIVFKFDDIAYGRSLGNTSHHFRNAIAYKFYDELYESHLEDIEWTMGRTGVLTPVAIFDPIDMDGSVIERASMHNISVMRELLGDTPYRGQKINVFKANMIIPQIFNAEISNLVDWVIDKGYMLKSPAVCPICGGEVRVLESDSGVLNLHCINGECEGKLINKLDHFCGKKGLDIKGLSKAILEKLIDWGWIYKISDIFELKNHQSEWAKKPGFGVKSVGNILNAIESSKNVTLDKFIASLGIPLIGSTIAKQMAKKEPDYFNIREDIEGRYDFTNWDGFGDAMCNALWNFDYTQADYIYENYLSSHITNPLWIDPNKKEENPKDSLNGKTIVITGKLTEFKNRAELSAAIEAAGGKVTGSVSKNTDYLVNNDSTSSSSKNVSAKKLGIPIVTEKEFIKMFLSM